MEETPIKFCVKCGSEKVARTRKSGRTEYVCKQCANANNRRYKENNKDKVADGRKRYKQELKARAETDQELAKHLAELKHRHDQKRYEKSRETILQRNAEYRKNLPEEKRKIQAQKMAESHRNNPNRPATRAKWKQNNKGLVNASTAERFARKMLARPNWFEKHDIEQVYAHAKDGLHVDHIAPLRNWLVQGLHCLSNLQLLPSSDNISKGNRWWPEMPEYNEDDLEELRYLKWFVDSYQRRLDNS